MKRYMTLWLSLVLLGMTALALASVRAASGGQTTWTTDTLDDFVQGTMDGVDVWSAPGNVRLDRRWPSAVQVNDDTTEDQVDPRLVTFVSSSGGITTTYVAAVWEDGRNTEHCPDVYFSRSADGGQTWSANVMVQDPCDPNDPPYDDCACLYSPDITLRQADNSLWVVWQQDPSYDHIGPDDGDIYYSVSTDGGQTWSTATVLYDGSGLQVNPRIVSASSGYLYAVWEDERDDNGDIYVSRFNPAVDTAWSTPLKISDDTTDAEQKEPALTVDSAGNVYVAWGDEREKTYGDVYFTRWLQGSAWNAAAWSDNARLSDSSMDWEDDVALAVAADNTLLAAWRERVPTGATYDWQIVAARSQDQGQTWSRTVVNRLYDAAASLSDYSSPALTAGPQDHVYAAWVYCPNPTGNIANLLFAQSPDGGAHWTEPQTISLPPDSTDETTRPSLAVAAGGRVVAAWDGYGSGGFDVYAAAYPTNQYLPAGSYIRELDAGGTASWGTIAWTLGALRKAGAPSAGSGPVFATRSRTDASADWTDWYTYTASGADIPHPDGRYLQYRVTFASDGSTTPQLDRVDITYEPLWCAYQVFLPLVVRNYDSDTIDVTKLVETNDDILGISALRPDPYADAIAAGARVVNLEPMDTFFALWVPDGYEEMEDRRVMVIAHGHGGDAYREIGLELNFPGDPDYAIVAIQWWTGVDDVMYSGQQFYDFMDVALRYMEYKYHTQLDKCALRGWSFGSEISYEVTYLDRVQGGQRLALTISHDGFMRPDPDEMAVGREFTQNLYDGLYGSDAFSGTHFYLYTGEAHTNITNTQQVITDFGGTVERMVVDAEAGHDGFYIHPQYHEEALNIFYRLTP